MKPTSQRWSPMFVLFCLLARYASAHPGHGDGHDFSWDFDHLAQHPAATVAWLAVFVAAVWAVVRLTRSNDTRRHRH